jgi:hypothetical protein
MQEAIFVDGVPAKITVTDFRRHHLASFPKLADEKHDTLIADAIDAVYSMFKGISDLWDVHDRQTWYDKTVLCYRLLTAWYVADIYPLYLAGTPTMGGIPLKRKKIGGVDITFPDGASSSDWLDLLESLKSNVFGNKARLMITTAGKRFMLRNRRYV